MKRLFTLLAALMLTVTASFAQQNFYFWGKNGNVSIEPVSEVDSLTFSVGSWLFQISKPVNLAATTSSFQGSAKVAFNDKVKSIDVTPEVGICYSDVNRTPNYDDFKKKLGSAMQDYSFTIMYLTSGTTYYYRTYVKLLDNVYYSAVNSITTMGEKPRNKVINGHEFVDLGLPSGLLWAKTNVGASSSSDDGDYFAWGETEPTSYYAWSTYKWGDDKTKYNSSDGKTTLDSEDDAATVNWGAPCRMPNSSEFKELYDKCDWSWRANYYLGRNGFLVKGPNGNTIFFPASGYRIYGDRYDHGLDGYYWSRSLESSGLAYDLEFHNLNVYTASYYARNHGFPVRPVADFGEKPSSYHIYYMVGELTGWSTSNKDFAFYPESNTVHSYTAQFTGDLKIWMKDDFGNWDTAYGAIFDGDDSESGSLTQSGAGNIVCPEPGAYYTLTVDFANMSYEWTKVADQNPTTYYSVSLIGGFNSWTTDYDLTEVIPHNWHTVFTLESATELKFRANHDWGVDWGDGGDINKKEYGKGSSCGNNINCPAGTYDVFFNDITGEYLFVVK